MQGMDMVGSSSKIGVWPFWVGDRTVLSCGLTGIEFEQNCQKWPHIGIHARCHCFMVHKLLPVLRLAGCGPRSGGSDKVRRLPKVALAANPTLQPKRARLKIEHPFR